MNEPIRILHVLQRMEAGGTQAILMNIYRTIDRNKIQFDFLVEYPEEQFYDEEILRLGGKIYYSSVRENFNIFDFQYKLKKIIKENDYKIIHVHAYTIGYFVLKTAKKLGVPIRIAHSHSNSMTIDWKKHIKKILQKLYLLYATDFMACSKEAGEYLFGNRKFEILKNSIDTEKFKYDESIRNKIRKELNLNDDFVVGHVGRFRPEKNHSFLIDVFEQIKFKKKNAKLLLIGNGDPNDDILEKIKNKNLNDSVIILSNRKDVNELYQAMDVFVFPSIYEGLGIVSIEAQASGLPTITSTGLPKEVEISNNLKRISLELGPQKWSEEVINIFNSVERKDMSICIKKAGYDIKQQAKAVEKYYLMKYDNK